MAGTLTKIRPSVREKIDVHIIDVPIILQKLQKHIKEQMQLRCGPAETKSMFEQPRVKQDKWLPIQTSLKTDASRTRSELLFLDPNKSWGRKVTFSRKRILCIKVKQNGKKLIVRYKTYVPQYARVIEHCFMTFIEDLAHAVRGKLEVVSG